MTRNLLFITAFFCLGAISLPCAHADAKTDAHKAIQALYDKQNRAFARKDAEGVTADLANDFSATSIKGSTLGRDYVRGSVAGLLANAKSAFSRTTIQRFRLDKTRATATVRTHCAIDGTAPSSNKVSQFVDDRTHRDIWIKTGSGWKIRRLRVLWSLTTFNGKPIHADPAVFVLADKP